MEKFQKTQLDFFKTQLDFFKTQDFFQNSGQNFIKTQINEKSKSSGEVKCVQKKPAFTQKF